MKTVRIYKDNLREHILRSLFLSDSAIFLGGGILIAVTQFIFFNYVLHFFQLGLFLMSVFIAEVIFALVATLRIEQQSLYKILPRAFLFGVSRKKHQREGLETSTGDFSVQNNYLVRRKKLVAVYEVEPYDIALLNDAEREAFYHHIKVALHTLPSQVQLIVKKEKAEVKDYQKHFFSLYKDTERKREPLIASYIHDMSSLVESGKLQIVKYYCVFSTSLSSSKEDHFVQSTKKLNDMGIRFATALQGSHIAMRQLQHEELIAFCKGELQQI